MTLIIIVDRLIELLRQILSNYKLPTNIRGVKVSILKIIPIFSPLMALYNIRVLLWPEKYVFET